MPKPRLPKVAVIGGSIAGLSTGIALRCLGCDVQIYEQSPTMLRGRGGGLVVQYEMLDWMTTHGIAALTTLSLPGVERQFLDRNGRVIQRFPDSTPFTSWDAVFHQLRAAFPDEAYHHGYQCVRVSTASERPIIEFASGERAEADLVIGADGVGSVVRRHLFPDAHPVYAGYVAWRGVFPELLAPTEVVDTLARRFTLFQGTDFHLLTYLIPGEHGELATGARRLNWVWYWNTDEHRDLPDILRDRDGRPHRSSVPAGKVQQQHIAAIQQRADKHLPPVLSQLVRATPEPFVQVIYDLRTPAMSKGSVAILGDSACVVRPHTAAGTSKASGDAVSLAQHLEAADFDLSVALSRWQTERLAVADRLIHHGWRVARNSGLGK
jgi:2-polyprenyl-6-methoxyphenol hydroxylase and related FAD-dependent oxidoreductases